GLNTLAIAIRKDANFLDSETCSGPRVFTPHPAEFQRLAEAFSQSQHLQDDPTAAEDRPRLAAWLARVCRSAVVLKGKNTVVSDAAGSTHFVNQTGNPALATAGTGDVLTGLIAGLMAQGMPAFDAACLGVHIHGVAADAWSQNNGPGGLLAEELADQLPTAIHALRRN
ncbi:MAG: ADP/ATP-dependent (S)-NAD(P)H-hydrate dehydratase, partial [Planctomycetota bacterium]